MPTQVLIIEDDLNWLKIFHLLVGTATKDIFEYVHVGDIPSALALLETQDFGLILLDLLLPDSFVHETFASMESYARRIPTIVMTTLEDEGLMSQAFKHGVEDYLVKDKYNLQIFLHVSRRSIQRFMNKLAVSVKDDIAMILTRFKNLDINLEQMERSLPPLP